MNHGFLMNVTQSLNCDDYFGGQYYDPVREWWEKLVLSVMYFSVFSLVVIHSWRTRVHNRKFTVVTTQKVFYALLMGANFVRTVTFALPMRFFSESSLSVEFIGQTLPASLYFSTYFLLFFYYISVLHRAVRLSSRSQQRRAYIVYMGVNVVVYVMFLLLVICVHVRRDVNYDKMSEIAKYYVLSLSVLVMACALVYGVLVSCNLRHYNTVSTSGRAIVRSVSIIMTICIVAYVAKVPGILVLHDRLCANHRMSRPTYQIVMVAYLLCVDMIPSLLVLYLVGKKPLPRRSVLTPKLTAANNSKSYYGSTGKSRVIGGHSDSDYTPSSQHHRRDSLLDEAFGDENNLTKLYRRFDEIDPLYWSFAASDVHSSHNGRNANDGVDDDARSVGSRAHMQSGVDDDDDVYMSGPHSPSTVPHSPRDPPAFVL